MGLDVEFLKARLRLYEDEIDKCKQQGTYWALLHLIVCLPDICAALESANGEASPARYEAWCKANELPNVMLTTAERYEMRCKLLHQGYPSPDPRKAGRRWHGYAFVPPGVNNETCVQVGQNQLQVDVAKLADEVVQGMRRWVERLRSDSSGQAAMNVSRNLSALATVSPLTQSMGQPPTTARSVSMMTTGRR